MAKKVQTVYVCTECGYESPKWMGQCICGAWNTMAEEKVLPQAGEDKRRRTGSGRSAGGAAAGASSGSFSPVGRGGKPLPLSSVKSGEKDRIDTGIEELNRVLGGGLVKGSLTLISGEPGIGKSTLILQAAAKIAERCGKVLYVSGEESEEQIKMRADRICKKIPDSLYILSETNMENIILRKEQIDPVFLIIDSIQTMYSADIDSAPGTISQVRVCGNELMRIGKGSDLPILIVAHVTKSGDLAGPKIVEHLVDTVLYFTGERSHDLRILRSLKNRFGTTNEIGAFEMREEGLTEVVNLSETLIEEMNESSEGSAAAAVYEGTRPLILEIQALTSPTNAGFPRRTSIGIDHNRLNMILAVLERRAGISLASQDVYLNIVGGIRPEGTSSDLAVALAVYSSYRSIPVPAKTLCLGEISLTGDLRSISHAEKIVKEAARMGFHRVMLPRQNAEKLKKIDGIDIIAVKTLRDALKILK